MPNDTHACTRTDMVLHYHVIPKSSQSIEFSWNVQKHSGRKAMLSRLGGAAMTSSGPTCSLDSWSGNSRQDETHPDTLTALVLPTVTARAELFVQNILFSSDFCFSDLGSVTQTETWQRAQKKKCSSDTSCNLWVFCFFSFAFKKYVSFLKKQKIKRRASHGSSYCLFSLVTVV